MSGFLRWHASSKNRSRTALFSSLAIAHLRCTLLNLAPNASRQRRSVRGAPSDKVAFDPHLTDLSDLYATALATTTDQQTVTGLRGMVSTSHPLATAAGVGVLRAGGNAVDAAISVAATLGAVEPSMSGPGGSGCLLVHRADTGEQLVLDFMGRLPRDLPDIPWSETELMTGLAGGLVPAAAAGWLEAHRRFGCLSRAAVFADAIELADMGVPLTPRNAGWATRSRRRIEPDPV